MSSIRQKKTIVGLVAIIIAALFFSCSVGQREVLPAPKGFFIKEGEDINFTYWDYDISINYLSADPQQVLVKVDGKVIKEINKSIDDFPRGVYWKFEDLRFELKPVIWRINEEDRNLPYFEETWNTTELYFEVCILSPYPSENNFIKKMGAIGMVIAIAVIITAIIVTKKIRRRTK